MVTKYFQILEDTPIGFRIHGFTKTTKRKSISRAKHYLFDLGVANASTKHLRGLRALREEGLFKRYMVVSRDEPKRVTDDGIEIYPYRRFLGELCSGSIWQA